MAEEPKVGQNTGNRGKGRPKGSPNKTTAIIKDAIIQAATNAGDGDMVEYLTQQARLNPGPFMSLLGKVLPTQLDGQVTHQAGDSISALMERIANNGKRIHSD